MTLVSTKKFESGNTVYFECTFRNQLSQLEDPTNPTWQIQDIKDATIASGSLTKKSTGVFYFFWTATTIGDFIALFQGTLDSGTYAAVIRRPFKVVRTSLKGEYSSSSSSSCSSSSCSSSSCSSSCCSSSSSFSSSSSSSFSSSSSSSSCSSSSSSSSSFSSSSSSEST